MTEHEVELQQGAALLAKHKAGVRLANVQQRIATALDSLKTFADYFRENPIQFQDKDRTRSGKAWDADTLNRLLDGATGVLDRDGIRKLADELRAAEDEAKATEEKARRLGVG